MGIPELDSSQHPTDSLHPSVPRFEKFQDFISHIGILYNIEGILSASPYQPNAYLFPINDKVILNEYQMENLGTEMEMHALRHPITFTRSDDTYDEQNEILFQRFIVLSDDNNSNLCVVLYPSKYYAEQVKEADMLVYEIHRCTDINKRQDMSVRIAELRKNFPTVAISKNRLLELERDEK